MSSVCNVPVRRVVALSKAFSPRRRSGATTLLFTILLWTAPVWAAVVTGCGAPKQPHVKHHMTTFWTDVPELEEPLKAAVARLSKATGRYDIGVYPDGVPVLVNDDPRYAGEHVCALTGANGWAEPVMVEIDLTPPAGRCMPLEEVLTHELMHALSPGHPHAEEGLFAGRDGIRTLKLSESSLSRLCESFTCLAFDPER